MFTIINKQMLAKGIKRIDVLADEIAPVVQPGQFVMVVPTEKSEWIPLSVVEADATRGTIALIFQERGPSTLELGAVPINESLFAVMGPFGRPATIRMSGCVVCVSAGVGIASMLPICRALRRAENKVISVLGARNKRSLLLEPQMRLTSHRLVVATEDGSAGRKGLATDLLGEVLRKENAALVYAVGPVPLMREAVALARGMGIPSLVQVNSVMHCGSGICGSCRLEVAKKDRKSVV